MQREIFVLGNPLVEEDSFALRISALLQKHFPEIGFRQIESILDLQEVPKRLIVMDVVDGIERVMHVRNPRFLTQHKIVSGHDFDSGMQLQLLQKLGKLKEVEVIGVPKKYDLKKAAGEARQIIEKITRLE